MSVIFCNNIYKSLCPSCNLSTQDNVKLFKQLKSVFKRTIDWIEYESKVSLEAPNLNFLVNPSFQGVSRLFLLSFENNGDGTVHTKDCLPVVKIKDCNLTIDGRNFLDQSIKNTLITNDNVRKIASGQGDDYTTGCL